jgi:hypothetical protein
MVSVAKVIPTSLALALRSLESAAAPRLFRM